MIPYIRGWLTNFSQEIISFGTFAIGVINISHFWLWSFDKTRKLGSGNWELTGASNSREGRGSWGWTLFGNNVGHFQIENIGYFLLNCSTGGANVAKIFIEFVQRMSNESSSEKAKVPLLPETYHVLILQAGRIYTERMIACELRFGCLTMVQVVVKLFINQWHPA